MNQINLIAGQTTQPYPVGIGSIVSLAAANNVATWSGYVEYSLSPQQQIDAGTATWTTWPYGTVTSAVMDKAIYVMYARAICLTGQITATFGDPNGDLSSIVYPWFSSYGFTTPSGTPAGINFPAMTFANRPLPASNYQGAVIRFTDVGGNTSGVGGGNYCFATSSRWKPMGGNVTLDSVDTPNTSPANTSENQLNPNHIAVPAGLLGANGDRLRIRLTLTKSGAAETATIRLRYGPLGTSADPLLLSNATDLATTNITTGNVYDFKRVSATSIQKEGSGSTSNPYGGGSSGAFPAAVTVSNMNLNDMYLSITSQVNVGAETVTLQDYTLEFWPTDSA